MSRSPLSYALLAPSQRIKYAELQKLYPAGVLLLDNAEPVFTWMAPLGSIEYNLTTGTVRYSLTAQPLEKVHH
jgi:hypothetical protein